MDEAKLRIDLASAPRRYRRANSRRRGVVILIAALFLVMATFVTIRLATAMVSEHRQMRLRQRQLQSVWLAESGIERAVAKLRWDAAYEGETWTLPAETTGQAFGGVVEIQINMVDGESQRRLVSVVADFPAELPHRVRRSKTIAVDLSDTGDPS